MNKIIHNFYKLENSQLSHEITVEEVVVPKKNCNKILNLYLTTDYIETENDDQCVHVQNFKKRERFIVSNKNRKYLFECSFFHQKIVLPHQLMMSYIIKKRSEIKIDN